MQTFCNDDDITGKGFVQVNNGVQTSDLIDQITQADYHVCNKMGTSIPNIFARMFLFASAYHDISSLENKFADGKHPYKGQAHNFSINPKTEQQYTSIYHYLISEHLDMLEFLFYYGHEVTFVPWTLQNFNAAINRDNVAYDDSEKRLARFADAIKDAIVNDTPLFNQNEGIQFVMIKYKGELVGGTSPSLFVYTNPNWKSVIAEKGWSFNGLFVDAPPRPLHERSLPFRKLLTLLAKGGMFTSAGSGDFCTYVCDNMTNGYDNAIKNWWNELVNAQTGAVDGWINTEISKIADCIQWKDANEVSYPLQSPIEGVNIYKQSAHHTFNTQYKISPTRPQNVWGVENVYGNNVHLDGSPMLIVEGGINGARYYENEYWNNTTTIPVYSQLKNQYLSQRDVPGKNGTKYPILTVDDLLEENIAELPYIVDRDHFFTACDEDFNFMLPIKRMYFRFFTFEDLRNNLKIRFTRDAEGNILSVNVSLVIPMPNVPGKSYTITRNYSYGDNARFRIVDCRKVKNLFNMGIFPFTKFSANSSYRFMLGVKQSEGVKCRLCNFDKAGFTLANDRKTESSDLNFKLRSTGENGTYKTYFASHQGNFDFIEFEIENDNINGMFIPLMKTIERGTDYKWAYAVDFGTSNTHVVIADTTQGIIQTAKKFEYTTSSNQMVTLGLSRNNRFQRFESDILREFVPQELGGDKVEFPIRSVIYEKEQHTNNMELFTERNVGFNYKNELAATFRDNVYISDLKWDIFGKAEFKCRIQAYCYQLLWMIRNHSVTNGGTEKFKLAITYPISMRPAQLRTIKEAWNTAWKDLVDSNSDFPQQNFKSESVAPYKYSMDKLGSDLNRTDAYLNVDIGGGSTDILYYKETPNQPTVSRAYSIFFAANDLWGNGINPAREMSKENGFIRNLEAELNETPDNNDKLDMLRNYKAVASNSADVCTYLFSKPETYHFKDTICGSQISSVVVMHFAAIIYYIAGIIKTERLAVPKCINFTGMGSKYLEIVSTSNAELEELIKVIFKLSGINDAQDIKVKRESNPKEVTALGALYMLDPRALTVQLPQSRVVYCIDGEDDIEEALTYNDTLNENSAIYMEMTMEEIDKFKQILSSPDFNNIVTNLGLPYNYQTLENNGLCKEALDSSYMIVQDNIRNEGSDSLQNRLMDAPFFWALKDTLYTIANNIANHA